MHSLIPAHTHAPRRTYRCSFTLPVPMATTLNRVAKRLNISQSALLAELLDGPLQDLLRMVELLPAQGVPPTHEQVKRLTKTSAEIVRQRVQEAREVAATLDPEAELPL